MCYLQCKIYHCVRMGVSLLVNPQCYNVSSFGINKKSLSQPLNTHYSSYFVAVWVFIFLDTEYAAGAVLEVEEEEEKEKEKIEEKYGEDEAGDRKIEFKGAAPPASLGSLVMSWLGVYLFLFCYLRIKLTVCGGQVIGCVLLTRAAYNDIVTESSFFSSIGEIKIKCSRSNLCFQ